MGSEIGADVEQELDRVYEGNCLELIGGGSRRWSITGSRRSS